MENWFNVGKIVNTHGIRGEVRVISMTDFPDERYIPGNTLYLFLPNKQEPTPLTVKSHRKHKNFDLLAFEGYDDVNEVEKWKTAMLKVHREQLSELPEGEYYFYEIIGCRVITEQGENIGIVKEILTPGANDVWVVEDKNGKDQLIPYIPDIVKKVSVAEKKIIIDPMEGLLT
ncbi:ribosome maturation factor RimM [Siminovitchia sediminis]|uniref:Ribosome maturation factor RimM n=1 Tax=Siminovitchia sediminis TaxID=1274353 RepID=A0ABW4KDD5_9BACI